MNEPLYLKIYNSLKRDIENGTYRPLDRVPTEEGLANMFGVSKITSKRALNMLAEEGWLIRQKGRGTFVADIRHLLPPSGDLSLSNTSKTSQAPIQSALPLLPGYISNDGRSAQKEAAPMTGYPGDQLPHIGLIYPEISGDLGGDLVAAVADACHGRAHLLFSLSHNDFKREEEAIHQMAAAQVDGLIVFPGSAQFLNPHLLQMVIDRYPLVLIDQNIPAINQTSVSTDNTDAIFKALSYIADHGHEKVSIILPSVSNNVLQERLDAVFQYSATTGFPLHPELWLKDVNIHFDRLNESTDRISGHLHEHPEITAVLCLQYDTAVAVKQAACQIGRQVGRDLALLCFDSPIPLLGKPEFTHIHQDEEAIGREAVELILDQIRQRDLPARNVRIPAVLMEGSSFFVRNIQ